MLLIEKDAELNALQLQKERSMWKPGLSAPSLLAAARLGKHYCRLAQHTLHFRSVPGTSGKLYPYEIGKFTIMNLVK